MLHVRTHPHAHAHTATLILTQWCTSTLCNVLQVPRLVYSSTCAVYGNAVSLPVTEETPPSPNNAYGQAKLNAESVVHHFASAAARRASEAAGGGGPAGFSAAILRYFNVYGSDPAGRLGE